MPNKKKNKNNPEKNMNKKALFRKNNLEKKMNKTGGNETMWPRIIGLIILACIIFVAAGAIYQSGTVQRFTALFPSYAKENLSDEQLRGFGCDQPIAQMRLDGIYGFRYKVIYMLKTNHVTNVVWDYKNGKLYFQYGDKIFGEGNIVIGNIDKGIVKIKPEFLNPNSETFLKYKYDLATWTGLTATIDDLKLLDNSYKLDNKDYLCKNDVQLDEYKQSLTCNLSCSIINGACSASGGNLNNYISYGQLDCPASQECYVKQIENIRENGKLYIDSFTISQPIRNGRPDMKNMFFEDTFNVNYGNGLTYGNELTIFASASKNSAPFCYSLASDKKILGSGYVSEFTTDYPTNFKFTPSIEKSLQYIAWNKSNKVIKRVNLNITQKYSDGIQIIDGKDIKSIIDAAEIGTVFYISIPSVLLKDGKTRISEFRIKVISNDAVTVEGQVYEMVSHGDMSSGENVWKQLNCNIGTTNSKLYIKKIAVSENSFRETVLKNCEMDKYWGLFG